MPQLEQYTRQLIGHTEINISGQRANIALWRNEDGNIERVIVDEMIHCPNGTCLEGYNNEIIITKHVD